MGQHKHSYTRTYLKVKSDRKEKEVIIIASGIPRRSPIQILTEPDFAKLRGSGENRCFQRGMAVDDDKKKMTLYKPYVDG